MKVALFSLRERESLASILGHQLADTQLQRRVQMSIPSQVFQESCHAYFHGAGQFVSIEGSNEGRFKRVEHIPR